jgi:hypothetical protein
MYHSTLSVSKSSSYNTAVEKWIDIIVLLPMLVVILIFSLVAWGMLCLFHDGVFRVRGR